MNESTKRATRETRESFDKTMETGAETVRAAEGGFTFALENVRDLNVRLLAMARANSDAAFAFAHDVTTAEKPSDFIDAWTTHATKQFDLLTKQATELTSLGPRFAYGTMQSASGQK